MQYCLMIFWPDLTDSTTPVSYSVARRSRKIPPPFHPRLYDCSGAEHGREIWPVGINKTWDKDNDYISQQSHCQSARLLKSPAVRVTHFSQLTCGYSRVSTMAAIVARLTRRRRQREALSAEYDYETSKVERREDFSKDIPIINVLVHVWAATLWEDFSPAPAQQVPDEEERRDGEILQQPGLLSELCQQTPGDWAEEDNDGETHITFHLETVLLWDISHRLVTQLTAQ